MLRPLFATIRDYSHYSYYSRLFALLVLFALFVLFATIRCSLFATIRYSLFGFSRHPNLNQFLPPSNKKENYLHQASGVPVVPGFSSSTKYHSMIWSDILTPWKPWSDGTLFLQVFFPTLHCLKNTMRYIKNRLLIGHHSNIVKDTYLKFVDKILFLSFAV